MKRKLLLISYFALMLGIPYASSQMTLTDCLIYARDHAHKNIAGRLQVERAQAEHRLALSSMLPYVGLNSGGNLSFGRNIDPETNTYDNRQTLSTSFGLSIQVPIFDGLVSLNNYKAAKVARLRLQQSAQIEEDQISLSVIHSFYNVSYCKAMVEQMKYQLQRDSTQLAACIRQEKMGVKSGADVADVEAIVASDQYELVNQQSLLSKAYLQLRSDMGMEISDTPLDLSEETSWERGLISPEHPRVAEARMTLLESQHHLRAARGAFFPSISFSGGISTSYYKMMGPHTADVPSFGKQWRDNMGEYVGISFSLPIFTGLANESRLKRAKISVMESQNHLNQTEYELRKETEEARIDLKNAEEEYTAAERRLKAEQIAYDATSRKFELGTASAIDLYTSGMKLATARATLEGKRIQKIISAITLDYYQGHKLINVN